MNEKTNYLSKKFGGTETNGYLRGGFGSRMPRKEAYAQGNQVENLSCTCSCNPHRKRAWHPKVTANKWEDAMPRWRARRPATSAEK